MRRGWKYTRHVALGLCLPVFDVLSAKAESSGLPQLDAMWFPSQILWTAVTMGIMILLAKYVFIPRVKNTKDKRKEHTDSMISRVEILQKKIVHLGNEINSLKEAHKVSVKTLQMTAQAKEKEALDSLNNTIKITNEAKQKELQEHLKEFHAQIQTSWEDNIQQTAKKIADKALKPHTAQEKML